ncbi:S8 family serine peptidase [Nanoarchaeota archaeon]
MNVREFLLITVILLILSSFTVIAADIDNSIEDLLLEENEVDVIIVLKDNNKLDNINEDLKEVQEEIKEPEIIKEEIEELVEEKQEEINDIQDEFLDDLNFQEGDDISTATRVVKYEYDQAEETVSIKETEIDLKIKDKYDNVNAISGKITQEGLDKLEDNPNVERVIVDGTLRALLDVSMPKINADDVWDLEFNNEYITGKHETVCVIDTGVDYTHPDLGGSWGEIVIGGYDFVNDDADPMDDHGHGTHVAGIISSQNETWKGVAPDTKIVAMKVLDDGGEGSFSDTAAAIDWCINNASELNISIISMSLGADWSGCSDPPANAIESAREAGIIVFVASGNDGFSDHILFPACSPNSTSVGASTDTDLVAGYSNTASDLDMLAPGSNIYSTVPTGACVHCTTSKWKSISGTSMATPHASAVAALLIQYKKLESNYTLSPDEIETTLMETGVNLTDADNGLTFPRIDALAAYKSLDTNAPTLTFDQPTPDNYSSTSTTWTIINISSNELLSSALLEWNNSNYSLTNTNDYWSINISGQGLYDYQIYGNDSANNFGVTETRVVYLNNQDPLIEYESPNETDIIIFENQSQEFQHISSDPNDDDLTYDWLLNDESQATTQNWTYTPTSTSSGIYNVTLTVSDEFSSISTSWNLTVLNINFAPEIFIETLNVIEDESLSYQVNASDADNEDLTYSHDLTHQNFSLNSTGFMTWQTNASDIGVYNFNLTVCDNSSEINNCTTEIATINVTEFNDPPYLLLTPPNINMVEDTFNDSLNLSIYYDDEESGSSLIYFASSNIANVIPTINGDILNVSATNDYFGQALIYVNVSDGVNNFSDVIIVIIDGRFDMFDFNISNPDNASLVELGQPIQFNVSTYNPENINFTYVWDFGDENSTEENPTNIFTEINSYEISLIVSDGENSSDDSITITTQDTTAPIINPNYSSSIMKNHDLIVYANFSDASNISNQTLTYNGSLIDSSQDGNSYVWTIDDLTVLGTYNFSIYVIDDYDNDNTTIYEFNVINCTEDWSCGSWSSCLGGEEIRTCTDANYCGTTYDQPEESQSCSSSSGGGGGGGASYATPEEVTQISTYKKTYAIGSVTPNSGLSISPSKEGLSINSLNVDVSNSKSNVQVDVETLESKPTALPEPPKKYYKINKIQVTNVVEDDIINAEIGFKVEKSWFNNHDVESVKLMRYHGEEWVDLFTVKASEDDTYIYFKSITPGFSYFAITADEMVVEEVVPVETPIEETEGPVMTSQNEVLPVEPELSATSGSAVQEIIDNDSKEIIEEENVIENAEEIQSNNTIQLISLAAFILVIVGLIALGISKYIKTPKEPDTLISKINKDILDIEKKSSNVEKESIRAIKRSKIHHHKKHHKMKKVYHKRDMELHLVNIDKVKKKK